MAPRKRDVGVGFVSVDIIKSFPAPDTRSRTKDLLITLSIPSTVSRSSHLSYVRV